MRHRQRLHHARLMGGAAFVALALVAGAAQAASISIAPQPLDTALNELGVQSSQQVLIRSDVTTGKMTRGVSNAPNFETALSAVLAGTGLGYRKEGDTYLIVQAGEGGSGPQAEGAGDVDALIVTAQKKEEAIQDVPIAISAFTQKSLDAQKIEGGFDLLKAIPNVTFSKNNFTGYNFSIRGIGTKAISASTDPAVAVAFNNSTLIVNRLFEQEYFDVERVEVLRGPQGTLYGRNATSGVINVISAKPRLGEFEGELKLEAGSYSAQRMRGMVNVPIGDTLALRVAGAATKRDGFGVNVSDGQDVDDRDLWSLRTTLGWEPNERLRAILLWERFREDDGRVRTSKQLCHRDEGLQSVNGIAVTYTAALSQGCSAGSLYDVAAFGTPRGASFPFVAASNSPNLFDPDYDIYGQDQSHDLREIESLIEPKYQAKADLFDLSVDFDLTDALTITSQTLYSRDEVYSTQDFNRFHTKPQVFRNHSAEDNSFFDTYYGPGWSNYFDHLVEDYVFCDPQLGCSDKMVAQDLSMAESSQFNQEFRLASSFDGPVNFSLGANYTRFRTQNDYYVFINFLTYLAKQQAIFTNGNFGCDAVQAAVTGCLVYVDPTPLDQIDDGDGHNYFRSKNPYRLTSTAVFGELYWEATPDITVTAGLRFTWDQKIFTPVASQTLLKDYRETTGVGVGPETCVSLPACGVSGTGAAGRGYPTEPDIVQEWREPTGRLVVDWKPDLGFTDETMLFASFAHGYKGGGANPPSIAAPSGTLNEAGRTAEAGRTFAPEFVDALEFGTKNTLMDGRLVLNAGAFFYDYKDYQVSKIVDRTANNENFDATIWGLELESIFSLTHDLRFNIALGYLDTAIGDGEQSIDLMDRTQGDPAWVVVKPSFLQASNCIAPANLVAALLASGASDLTPFCAAGNLAGQRYSTSAIPGTPGLLFNPATDAPNGGAGFFADVSGNELPNAPHVTASLGAQYRMALPGGWDATLRGDFYWQSQSWARVYNAVNDKLHGWSNTNISLWVENPDWGVTAEVYVKNAFDETPITDAFLNSDDTGLTTNVFTLDPRLVGVSIRKSF